MRTHSLTMISSALLVSMILSALMPINPVLALSGISINLRTPFATLEQSNSCDDGPLSMYVQIEVGNTTGAPITNLTAYIDSIVPVANPNPGNNHYDPTNPNFTPYQMDPGEITSRFIGTLAPGEHRNLFWYVNYPCFEGAHPPAWSATINVRVSNGIAPDVNQAVILTTRDEQRANAGGQLVSQTIGPGIFLGQIVPMTVVYEFGNTGAPQDGFIMPAGNPSHVSGCFQLIDLEITAMSGNWTFGPGSPTIGADDLYYPGFDTSSTNNLMTVVYYFKATCTGSSSLLQPWSDLGSGTQYKYTGNFPFCSAGSNCVIPAPVNSMTLTKQVRTYPVVDSPVDSLSLPIGGTVEYIVTVNNSGSQPVFLDQLLDNLPANVTYGALVNGADCPGTNEVTTANSYIYPSSGAPNPLTWTANPIQYPLPADPSTLYYYIPSGSSLSLCYTASVPNTAGTYINQAAAVAGSETIGPDSATVLVGTPAFTIVKDADVASVAAAGDVITYTITLSNTGNLTLTGVSVSDPLLTNEDCDGTAGAPYVNTGLTIAVGGSLSCTGSYTVSQTDLDNNGGGDGDLDNTVTGDSDQTGTQTAMEAVLIDLPSSILVTKSAAPASLDEPGGSVTFTVRVDNTSAVDEVTISSLTDSVYGDLSDPSNPDIISSTCTVPKLIAAGGFIECTFSATVNGNAGDVETDTATASGLDDDGHAVSGLDDATVSITDVLPGVTVIKTADDNSIPETGQSVIFTFRVTNDSTESAVINSLNDDQFGALAGDADCHVGTILVAGGFCEFTYTTTLSGTAPGTHVNSFTAQVLDGDGNSASDDDSETVTFEDVTAPSLTIAKQVSANAGGPWSDSITVNIGMTVYYQIIIVNTGDVDLTGVTVDDGMAGCILSGPSGDDGDGILEVIETWVYTCNVTALAGSHPNTAGADSNETGRLSDDASYYGSTPGITKTITGTDQEFTEGNDIAAIGEIITYQVDVIVPPGTFAAVSLVDTMQTGLSFVDCLSISGEAGLSIPGGFTAVCRAPVFDDTVDPDNIVAASTEFHRIVRFNLNGLINSAGVDQTLTFIFRGIVLDNEGNVGLEGSQTSLDNIAEFNYNGSVLTSNAVTINVVEPDLAIDKSADTQFIGSGSTPITFTLDVTHTIISLTDAFDVVLEDVLPAGLSYVANSLTCQPAPGYLAPDIGTCMESSGTISARWSNFLEDGVNSDIARVQFQVVANASLPASGSVTNVATLEWTSLACDETDQFCQPVAVTYRNNMASMGNSDWVSYRPKYELQYWHGSKYARIAKFSRSSAPFTGNVFSTERYYAPGDAVNNYGENDPVILTILGGGGGGGGGGDGEPRPRTGGGFLIPVTGFAPDVVTGLQNLPVDDPLLLTSMTLEIPSQKLTLPIVGVALKDGTWNVDSLWNQAGWLQQTAYPTYAGNSVITSHVVTADGKPGPFVRLKELQPGDRIYITSNGYRYMYVVQRLQFVQPNDISVLKHREDPWLTLVTCDAYDEKSGSYLRRVAVEAALVRIDPLK